MDFEGGITFTNDVDGVHIRGPWPFHTLIELLTKHFELPNENSELEPYFYGSGLLYELTTNFKIVFHAVRPRRKGAREGLAKLKAIADEEGINVESIVLSGRERPLHSLTRKQLQRSGYHSAENPLFDHYVLNETTSSSGWKAERIRSFVKSGRFVIHLEDDLRAALSVARIGPQVLVYLLANPSNHPTLIKHAGVELPTNVKLVKSFDEIVSDFQNLLNSEKHD